MIVLKNFPASIDVNQGHEELMLQDTSADKPTSDIAMTEAVAELMGVIYD